MSQERQRIIAAVIFIVLILCLANLVAAVEEITIIEEMKEPISPNPNATVGAAVDIPGGAFLTTFFMVSFIVIGITVLAADVIYRVVKKKSMKWYLYQIAGALLIIGLFLALFQLSSDPALAPPASPVSEGGELVAENSTSSIEETSLVSQNNFYRALVAVIFCADILLVIIVASHFISRKSRDLPDFVPDEGREEIARVVETAIIDIKGGADFRAAIIACYFDMCQLFEKYGVSQKASLTPREFKEIALDKLRINGDYLEELTSLFEEARYSEHEITGDKRDLAVRNLEQLKTDMEGEYSW